MSFFLAKSEPEVYSIDQLEQDEKTVWDGVVNPQAVKAIMAMATGDLVFFYHSGATAAIVGIAKVVKGGRPDSKNPKSALADFAFVTKLDPPTTLADIKASGKFEHFALVKQGRLSTMAVPEEFVKWMQSRYPDTKF